MCGAAKNKTDEEESKKDKWEFFYLNGNLETAEKQIYYKKHQIIQTEFLNITLSKCK